MPEEALELLEFLDHNRGRSTVEGLQRRGVSVALIASMAREGYLQQGGGAVQLTDQGAACLGGDRVASGARHALAERMAVAALDAQLPEADAEPEEGQHEEEEPMSPEELQQQRETSNGSGTTRDRILAVLAEHPDGLRVDKVADLLGITVGNARSTMKRMRDDAEVESVNLGSDPRKGQLWFVAGEAKVPPAPDMKATTKPKAKPKKAVARRSRREPEPAVTPPPSNPGELERYLGLLGRLSTIEPPSGDVMDQMERMLAIDAQVRS